MKTLSIDPVNPDPAIIALAARVLREGGSVVYPTDTCYGLGVDARSVRAMRRIAELKGGRAQTKRFSVIARDIDHIEELTLVDERTREILKAYLPGPFTFILMNADFQVARTSTLGVRIPQHAVTQALARGFADAYITTSANLEGRPALYSAGDLQEHFLAHVDQSLWPDIILDAGPLIEHPPSTVVDVTKPLPQILRQGGLPFVWPVE